MNMLGKMAGLWPYTTSYQNLIIFLRFQYQQKKLVVIARDAIVIQINGVPQKF